MKLNISKFMDLDEVKRLWRADLPTPIDVLNLIHFKDAEAYRWYAVMVFPTLKAVGGRVGWFGLHSESFLGEPQAEELGVVRYPNQRRFLSLVLNPYYVAVASPQRMKAVQRFNASFTHSPCSLDALSRSRWVLAVHHKAGPGATAALEKLMTTLGGQLVYHSTETSEINIAKRYHPANSNPIAFADTALVSYPSEEACQDAITAGALNQLKEVVGPEVSAQLYRRLYRSESFPAPLTRFVR
ncbi:MAG: hypothetical protein AAF500_02030 [Myxococcota bacterium]